MSKWQTIVLNNMLAAKRQGDAVAYKIWEDLLNV